MKRFIAYFDYLGFKKFIEKNSLEDQIQGMNNNFRDMESALSPGGYIKTPQGVAADISKSKINCINFSDTVVFWTNDDSEESLAEILDVAFKFNWQSVDYFFPVRGALVYGEIVHVDFKSENSGGGMYNINSVFGKGLVRAHEKAESQHWAGSVIDNSFTEELERRGHNLDSYLNPYAKKYVVPYKDGLLNPEEYVLKLITGKLNDTAFENYSNGIKRNFASYNKPIDSKDVKEKIENTILYLKSFY